MARAAGDRVKRSIAELRQHPLYFVAHTLRWSLPPVMTMLVWLMYERAGIAILIRKQSSVAIVALLGFAITVWWWADDFVSTHSYAHAHTH